MHELGINGFLEFVIVRNSIPVESTTLRKLDLFLSTSELRETSTVLVPLERTNLNYWIALSKRPIRTGVSFFSPEDGNRSSFRNVVFSS
jgi:hypothetical protein